MKKKKFASTYIHKEINYDKNKYGTPKINDSKPQKFYFSNKKIINLNNIEIKSYINYPCKFNRSKTNSKSKNSTRKNLFPKLDEFNQRNSSKSSKTLWKCITYNNNNSSSRKKIKSKKNTNSGIIKIINNKKIKHFERQRKKTLKSLILKQKFDRNNFENGLKKIDISIKSDKHSNLVKKYFHENEDKTKNGNDVKIKLDKSANSHDINHNSNYNIDNSLKSENKFSKIRLSLLPKAAIDISQSKQNKRYKNMKIVFNCDDVINFCVKLKHQNLTPEMINEIKELDTVISNVINEYNNINKI